MRNTLLKVKGDPNLVRDPNNMAILNTNRNDYNNYIIRKQSLMSDKELIANQAEEIKTLKEDLTEIKQMLSALLKDKEKCQQ